MKSGMQATLPDAHWIWNGNGPISPPTQPNHWTLVWMAISTLHLH